MSSPLLFFSPMIGSPDDYTCVQDKKDSGSCATRKRCDTTSICRALGLTTSTCLFPGSTGKCTETSKKCFADWECNDGHHSCVKEFDDGYCSCSATLTVKDSNGGTVVATIPACLSTEAIVDLSGIVCSGASNVVYKLWGKSNPSNTDPILFTSATLTWIQGTNLAPSSGFSSPLINNGANGYAWTADVTSGGGNCVTALGPNNFFVLPGVTACATTSSPTTTTTTTAAPTTATPIPGTSTTAPATTTTTTVPTAAPTTAPTSPPNVPTTITVPTSTPSCGVDNEGTGKDGAGTNEGCSTGTATGNKKKKGKDKKKVKKEKGKNNDKGKANKGKAKKGKGKDAKGKKKGRK